MVFYNVGLEVGASRRGVMSVYLCMGTGVIMEEYGGGNRDVIVRNRLSWESCQVFEDSRFIEL